MRPVSLWSSPASCGVIGAPGMLGTSSIHPPRCSVSSVCSLFAFQRARASVVSATHPTLTSFRTTHGASTSAATPRATAGSHVHPRRRQSTYAPSTSGMNSVRTLPRIISPEHPAEQSGPPQSTALDHDEREQHGSDREEVVEDFAVHVHVVPDEVRVQRRQHRGDEPDLPVDDATADLVDEPRRRDRQRDVREPDHEPASLEHPVERDEEEAVERLRVRGRDPRDEPVRPALEERQREVVALVDERVRDVASLHQQCGEPWQRGRDGQDAGMRCADPSAH